MLSSGIETTDHYLAIWGEAVFNGITQEETEIIGTYNKEEKSRREITAEFLFFELSAVGFFDSLFLLPGILIQAGILSFIMALTGFLCAVWLPDLIQNKK